MFSKRTSWELEPNRLTAVLEARRQRGEPVLDLMLSNPTRAGLTYPEGMWEALRRAEAPAYRPEPLDLSAARETVRAYYGEKSLDVAADRVLLTASTSEAYAFLFKLLTDPGDEILVPRPSYPLFEYLAGLEGAAVRPYPVRYGEGRWRVDVDRLAAAVSDRSRALVIVSPNNPTGSYVAPEDRAALEDLASDCSLALIADEVFTDYPVEAAGGELGSFAAGARVLTFTLSGLSKVLGLPQLKLGWVVVGGPEGEVREALSRLEVIADTYLSVGTPVQEALPELMTHRQEIQAAIRERLLRNLAELRTRVAAQDGVELLRCEGGWYAVVQIPVDAEELAVELLERDGVLVHPGAFYDFPPGEFLVVSLLCSDFAAGVERLLARLGA